jgi:hypothetical protein
MYDRRRSLPSSVRHVGEVERTSPNRATSGPDLDPLVLHGDFEPATRFVNP